MEHQDGTFDSHLTEMKGIETQETTNTSAIERFKNIKRSRKTLTTQDYVEGICRSDMTILSQAITLVESNLPEHKQAAQEIIQACLPYSGNSIRIGITGVPGVGKSTFIESFGTIVTAAGHKLAVLAIDPSSERTQGSILGDKTRMEQLSIDPNAYIRPSPSAGSLGGVARKTRETIILCEAAGFDVIFIETVGVGQSETAVHSMVDFFLLLMLAGAGDQLQGIKRGIMEMADSIAITKADGANEHKAAMARAEYSSALQLFPKHPSGVNPKVFVCSSIENKGLEVIFEHIKQYIATCKSNGYYDEKRKEQASYWLYETIQEQLQYDFFNNPAVAHSIKQFEHDVINGKTTSFTAAFALLDLYKKVPEL
ncbi:MAG: methylmalonyl Co-A mutase-associated GTPase MeaB [Bacteroidales bacterium]|jgi:LAO/AO transport system kinase|nr:methylmalonyl Co-A mutase-associated GTPase MeaB [Bacteroidales bacterium]